MVSGADRNFAGMGTKDGYSQIFQCLKIFLVFLNTDIKLSKDILSHIIGMGELPKRMMNELSVSDGILGSLKLGGTLKIPEPTSAPYLR